MTSVTSDPGQALALLPIDQSEQTERLWLQDTLSWLKSAAPERRTERLRELTRTIAGDAGIRARFQQLWTKAYAPRLFSEAALPEATSLTRELMVRVRRRLLPQVEDELDLYATLQMAELSEDDASWMEGLSDEDVAPWRELLCRPAADFPVAIRLLALRSASIGLSRSVMKVMPHQYETESPFFDLVDAAGRFARSPQLADQRERLRSIILPCRVSTTQAHENMEDQGVSADLVFRLDLVMAQLDRIDALLRVMEGREDGRAFASMLVRAVAGESSTRSLVSNGVNRVARHIVAHTGKSGEHYIAGSNAEWIHMGYGALGAGGVTAFTALFKYALAAAPLAPLWIGVAHSLNYTVSFVLMQFLGWSLASKMPSMTAAALSEALEKEDGMQSEVKLVAAITRTQTIVTVGNLLGAAPLALLIDALIRWRYGSAFLSHDAALHGLRSMGVGTSLTVVFAALTGGFLWCSSLCAGWTANWMVLHRLPAAIAQSRRIRRWMRPGAAVELAELVKHHLSGVAGYTALGLMLGLLPFVSVFAGFPVEVRHITLASASMAYDVSSLAWGGKVPWVEVGWAGLGLVATGLLNFGVSFALGLWLALRARNLDTNGRRRLVVALWKEFWGHPARFLWRHEEA
jgi:site-specific recombinase